MTRGLALTGAIALAFGLGSFYATDQLGAFALANFATGAAALIAAGIASVRGVRGTVGPHTRPTLLRGAARIVLAVAGAVLLERAAAYSGIELDFTQEGRYQLAEATLSVCRQLAPVRAILFFDPEDPRIRRTRTLLRVFERECSLAVDERVLDEAPQLEDRYGIASSNSVVVATARRFETIARPTEGSLYEALYRLRSTSNGVVTFLRGSGEGDVRSEVDNGYSGFATALETEGYRLLSAVSGALPRVPPGTNVLLSIAPRRRLPAASLAAIRTFLAGGGSLVALLEPGLESGIEEILADWGLATPEGVLVDPSLAGAGRSGVDILASAYETHPTTRGLSPNRMSFFPGARTFNLRRPRIDDRVRRTILASHLSWVSDDLSLLEGDPRQPVRDGQRQDYHPVAAAGAYERDGRSVRIVAFGDSEFASNRYLRALYNLDVAINAVHWAAEREPEITLRPKIRPLIQFPLPIQNTLSTLYGVGMLVPEVLLIVGSWVWLSRR